MRNLDGALKLALAKSLNTSVPWFLCTSLLYYQFEIGVVSDLLFDDMCHRMLDGWTKVRHPHKGFIKRSHLTAGTGFDLPFHKLPSIVWGGAFSMAKAVGQERALMRP